MAACPGKSLAILSTENKIALLTSEQIYVPLKGLQTLQAEVPLPIVQRLQGLPCRRVKAVSRTFSEHQKSKDNT